jgi:hypothetical protein
MGFKRKMNAQIKEFPDKIDDKYPRLRVEPDRRAELMQFGWMADLAFQYGTSFFL